MKPFTNKMLPAKKEFDDMALSKEDLEKQKIILKKSLELANLKRRKSIINAPFDGIVLEKRLRWATGYHQE